MEKKIWITYEKNPSLKKEGGSKITLTHITGTSDDKTELSFVLSMAKTALDESRGSLEVESPESDENSLN